MKKVKGKSIAITTGAASSSPCCSDNGGGCTVDTEKSPSSSSSSSSIQLSLPDSFDDTLDLSIVLDAETKGRHMMSGGSSSTNHPVSHPCPVRHQHLQTKQSKTEINILRSKLQEAAATIKALRSQIQVEKSSIQDTELLDDAECRYLSRLPPQELTLAQFAALTIHEKVATIKRTMECQQRKAQNATDVAEQDIEEAARIKEIAERRVGGMQEKLDRRQQLNNELQSTIKDLQSQIIDLKEKGRKYDAATERTTAAEAETDELRKTIQNHATQMEQCSIKETDRRQKLLDYEKRVQMLDMDKSYLQKENAILLDRAEESEKTASEQASILRDALTKSDAVQTELVKERDASKASYDNKLLAETRRIREECDRGMDQMRRGIGCNWDRENKLLRNARDDALHQLEQVQHELTGFRQRHDAMVLSHAKAIADMGKELGNARSDIKIKAYENANLLEAREAIRTDLKSTSAEKDRIKDQLSAHREQLSQLELESGIERKKLNDEIAQRDEQLEAYAQLELQVDSKIEAGKDPGGIGYLSCPKRRMEQAVMLAKKCTVMKKTAETLRSSLKVEQDANAALKTRLQVSEHAVSQMNQPSAYVVKSAKAREEELAKLRSENKGLHMELTSTRNEKQRLAHQLSDVLDRRQQLDEMKNLVRDLKNQQARKAPSELSPRPRSIGAQRCSACSSDQDEDDLTIHIVHHETSGL